MHGATVRLVSIALLALLAGGCDGPDDPIEERLRALREDPGSSPPAVAPGTPIVLLEVGVEGSTVALLRPPILQPGATLRLERALARGRTEPPPLWAVVAAPDGSVVRYWCATAQQATVRSTVRDAAGDDHHGNHPLGPGAVTSLRLPFEPRGQIRFYGAEGERIATFRFGDEAEDPVTRVDS